MLPTANSIAPKSIPKQVFGFDDFDIFLLAYFYPEVDLRHEIEHARVILPSIKVFDILPCAVLWSTAYDPYDADDLPAIYNHYTFDWEGWIKVCQEALNCRNLTAIKIQSKEKLPSKLIDIEAIKAKNDIVDIIGQHTKLRKSGNNRFTGRCPLHNDKGPSLTVYADSQSWHCFGACNKGGDIFSFIMALNSCDFKQAAALLGGQ